jgi:thioredoxin reductase (NADPH)
MTLQPHLRSPDQTDDEYDVVIIGGGPAGLSAALYAARAGLTTLVLDKNPGAGALALTHKIENYPGILQVMSGKDLLLNFHQQAESFGAKIVQAQVIGVDFSTYPRAVQTTDSSYRANAVIIATGSMGRTKPTLKGEAEFVGKGVSYCAICDAPFSKDKAVAVVGDIEEVLAELRIISRFARHIYLFLHGPDATAEEAAALQMMPNVEVMSGYHLTEILGDTSGVEKLSVVDPAGHSQQIGIWAVFIFLHGSHPIVDFLGDALATTATGCIHVDQDDMSTSIEGVYAIGDVTCKDIRQVVVAAAEGCVAALSADKYIHKRHKVRSLWS